MTSYKTVFTTERGQRHQQNALEAAPEYLDVTMLRQPSREELMRHLVKAEYFISERTGVIDSKMIAAATRLKMILRIGSLTFDIDTDAARAVNVVVCYWPVGGVIRVAEHMMLQMLALSKRLNEVQHVALEALPDWGESKRTDEDTFAYNWSRRSGIRQLWGNTIGILGFGEIGAELARRLRGWDCTVLYHKRRQLPRHVEEELGITYAEADDLVAQSDYLCNLLPYFPETDMLIDAAYLAQMKDDAYLVSCGSGSVIDEAALAEAIADGKLAGAALDTYEWEPIKPDNPLIALVKQGHNVILTPHTAAGGTDSERSGRAGDYTNIINHIEGKPLRYRVV